MLQQLDYTLFKTVLQELRLEDKLKLRLLNQYLNSVVLKHLFYNIRQDYFDGFENGVLLEYKKYIRYLTIDKDMELEDNELLKGLEINFEFKIGQVKKIDLTKFINLRYLVLSGELKNVNLIGLNNLNKLNLIKVYNLNGQIDTGIKLLDLVKDTYITSLTYIGKMDAKLIQFINEHFIHLEYLNLQNRLVNRRCDSNKQIEFDLKRIKILKLELILEKSEIKSIQFKQGKYLTNLNIKGDVNFTFDEINQVTYFNSKSIFVSYGFNKLTSLNLNCKWINEKEVITILNDNNLRFLNLIKAKDIHFKHMKVQSKLKILLLEFSEALDVHALEFINKRCSHLTSLSITQLIGEKHNFVHIKSDKLLSLRLNAFNIQQEELSQLLRHCKNLVHFYSSFKKCLEYAKHYDQELILKYSIY